MYSSSHPGCLYCYRSLPNCGHAHTGVEAREREEWVGCVAPHADAHVHMHCERGIARGRRGQRHRCHRGQQHPFSHLHVGGLRDEALRSVCARQRRVASESGARSQPSRSLSPPRPRSEVAARGLVGVVTGKYSTSSSTTIRACFSSSTTLLLLSARCSLASLSQRHAPPAT